MTRPKQVKINEATATAEQRDILKKWGKNRKQGGTLVQRFIDADASYRDFRKKEDGCNPANYDLFKEDLASVIYSKDEVALINRPVKSLDEETKEVRRKLQQKPAAYMGFMYSELKKLQAEKTDTLAKAIEEALREKLDAIKTKAQKHEGDCKINLSDFTRDINKVYETYFGKQS